MTDNKTKIILDGGRYMHGKLSWCVEGSFNKDLKVVRILSDEVVKYIRNRKPIQPRGVVFSFWCNITGL